jgi:hypothetical protein
MNQRNMIRARRETKCINRRMPANERNQIQMENTVQLEAETLAGASLEASQTNAIYMYKGVKASLVAEQTATNPGDRRISCCIRKGR